MMFIYERPEIPEKLLPGISSLLISCFNIKIMFPLQSKIP